MSKWLSVEEFETKHNETWCWIVHNGEVKMAYYLAPNFQVNNWYQPACYITAGINKVTPIEEPIHPAIEFIADEYRSKVERVIYESIK